MKVTVEKSGKNITELKFSQMLAKKGVYTTTLNPNITIVSFGNKYVFLVIHSDGVEAYHTGLNDGCWGSSKFVPSNSKVTFQNN